MKFSILRFSNIWKGNDSCDQFEKNEMAGPYSTYEGFGWETEGKRPL